MPNRNQVTHHGERGAHGPGGGKLYAGIPMELAREGKLSYLARSVAMYVWSHDEKWQQSASAVADALGMDRGSVGKALAELQEHGWLVREVHRIVGPSGKARTAWECWHLQMTNRPFNLDEIRELSEPSDVRTTPARSHQTCGPDPHGGAGETSTGGAGQTRTIEMDLRNAPEVHSSNAREGEDETGLTSRSLADAETEAPRSGADSRGRAGPSLGEAASAPAAEQPADRPAEPATEEHRPLGLQPPTTTGSPFDDPFSAESLRQRAALTPEAAARLQRADRHVRPATAGGPPASPWD